MTETLSATLVTTTTTATQYLTALTIALVSRTRSSWTRMRTASGIPVMTTSMVTAKTMAVTTAHLSPTRARRTATATEPGMRVRTTKTGTVHPTPWIVRPSIPPSSRARLRRATAWTTTATWRKTKVLSTPTSTASRIVWTRMTTTTGTRTKQTAHRLTRTCTTGRLNNVMGKTTTAAVKLTKRWGRLPAARGSAPTRCPIAWVASLRSATTWRVLG